MNPCIALLALCSLALLGGSPPKESLQTKATKLHAQLLTLDTHCDTPMRMSETWDVATRHEPGKRASGCQDLIRMKEGGLVASFFAVFVGQGPRTEAGHEAAKAKALQTLNRLDQLFLQHPDLCERALSPADVRRIHRTGKRAILIGLENGYPLGQDPANVDLFYQRGVRYITLAHSQDNDLASSSSDEKRLQDQGLTELGRQVLKRMNERGMIVDLSHISNQAFIDVIKLSKVPVMASHSCARAICDHPRNLSDEQLRALKQNGGVVQVCLVRDYVKKPEPGSAWSKAEADLSRRVKAVGGWYGIKDEKLLAGFEREWEDLSIQFRHELPSVKDLVDHIDHIVKVIGVQHVGIGTDFDGGGALRDCYDVTHLPRITEELLRRGYSERDIARIWGGNALRVMEAVQKAAVKGGRR